MGRVTEGFGGQRIALPVLPGGSHAGLLLFLAGRSRAAFCPSPRPSPHPMGRGGNILVRRFPGWRSVLADGHQSLPRAIIWLPFQGAQLVAVPGRDQREPARALPWFAWLFASRDYLAKSARFVRPFPKRQRAGALHDASRYQGAPDRACRRWLTEAGAMGS